MSQSLNEMSEIGRRLVQKWEPLMEGIGSAREQVNTAIILENQFQRGGLFEDTQSGQTAGYDWSAQDGTAAPNDIAPYQHYLLPLVRRVYPNLMANELVGVQPMTSPSSLVFYLKYRYTGLTELTANGGVDVDAGAGTQHPLNDNSVAKGSTAAGTEYANFVGNTWAIDPYYSLQKVWREAVDASDLVAATGTTAGGFSHTLLARPRIQGSDVTVRYVLTFAGVGEVILSHRWLTGTLAVERNTTNGAITGFADASSPGFVVTDNADGTTVVSTAGVTWAQAASPDVVPTVTASVTYEYDMEGNRQLPEIELEVSSESVVSQTRKLRTKWTIEASQDLRAMHNIDAEQELVALLSNEVTAEIDREIINDLITSALIRVEYDYSNPFIVGGWQGGAANGQGSLTNTAIAGVTSFDDRNKSLMYQILEVSNQIYRQSLRGAGNWIVTSPEVAAKLESLLEFKPDARTDFQYNLGIQYSGTINGQFKVYKDPLFPRDLILVGYKGTTFMDAGYFYCPYVPLQLTPTIMDPESFNPRKGLLTRYGKVLVENGARMYGVIRCLNLAAVGSDGLPDLTGTLGVTPENTVDQVSTGAISDPGSELI
jgi:hypothetical protein